MGVKTKVNYPSGISPSQIISYAKGNIKGIFMVLIIILVVVALLLLTLWLQYNGLVRLRNGTKNAWSQIDVQLRRRYDLIPNLVETVKGYAEHERETLEAVVEARNAAMAGQTIGEQAQNENMLSGALKSLFALSEAYPDLKANENFLQLQEELVSTESRIAFARQHYNDSVLGYNNKIETFPSNIVAGSFNFKQAEFFETEGEAQDPVEVTF
ncbi:MAG TPA: LemA family protein [Acidimicrobiales bacterium]|jgi:LemA protein|nr:LemA family protein [Acidimicrobiales bacterium]